MERKGAPLVQELRRWAAEEMKLPPGKIPSESAVRRMCSGQCAEIWSYVIRHVHHQRNVKKIRGNLLWYPFLVGGKPGSSESEKERRKQLVQGIARLREELQQIDLQIESAQQELVADEAALEASQEKIRDAKRRSLLLKAYSARVASERQQLRSRTLHVKGRLEQLEEMERKARAPVAFGGKASASGFPTLEPDVLRGVQEACQLRAQFLKTLFERSLAGSFEQMNKGSLSLFCFAIFLQKLAAFHPAAHILSALEHLALRSTQQLQQLTTNLNIPESSSPSVSVYRFRYNSGHLEDISDPKGDLPSVRHLIQQIPLQAQERKLVAQLEAVVQDVHRLLSDGSEHSILARAVFELELRAVRLRGYRDGLLQGCQQLEEAVRTKQAGLQGLQAKRQRILDFRRLVNEKQQHIRVLIKGTSYIKSQLRKDQAEAERVALETEQLRDRVDREIQQFRAVSLPCLLRRELPGSQCLPAHELSIHRLSPTAPAEYRAFLNVCSGAAFPLYKGPEQLLPHMADLKKMLLFLRTQLALVREVKAHDQEQARELLPRIQRVTEQCRCRIERWQEVQAIVDAWWEQPGQFALPGERRHGFTLQQWLERWTLAAKTLQQQQQKQHSWV
ncbi:hypothetical protein JRQ81_011650 [Phrynocephalus forsythii]|uniref:HAUS augmin-like complex subunit 5 n=1 Tax=Phrynocephalus forsythii TaxID=171643 RepID=A0A9Q1AQC4_9SAUR|nr:hypothetical protein JRQ81_011650 [Phrynocephalus forsythii]